MCTPGFGGSTPAESCHRPGLPPLSRTSRGAEPGSGDPRPHVVWGRAVSVQRDDLDIRVERAPVLDVKGEARRAHTVAEVRAAVVGEHGDRFSGRCRVTVPDSGAVDEPPVSTGSLSDSDGFCASSLSVIVIAATAAITTTAGMRTTAMTTNAVPHDQTTLHRPAPPRCSASAPRRRHVRTSSSRSLGCASPTGSGVQTKTWASVLSLGGSQR